MPWLKDENGKEYCLPDNADIVGHLTADEMFMAVHSQALLEELNEPNELDLFMFDQILKPINYNGKELKNETETKEFLDLYRGKPFDEATRGASGGSHFTTFCFANGMEFEDMLMLKNDPNNPKCKAIDEKLQNLRQDFYKMITCEDKKEQDSLVVDYYVKFMDRSEKLMDKFCQKEELDVNDYKQFGFVSDGFQSLGTQTLSIADKQEAKRNQGLYYVGLINDKLKNMKKPYTYENFFNTACFSAVGMQCGASSIRALRGKRGEVVDNNFVLDNLVSRPEKAFISIIEFNKFFAKGEKTAAQRLAELDDEKGMLIQQRTSPAEMDFDAAPLMKYSLKRARNAVSYVKELPSETEAILFQENRKTKFGTKENSPEFEAVKASYKKSYMDPNLSKEQRLANDISLYNACAKYINSKSSNPKSDVGKERPKAISNLMIRVGETIAEKKPEMAEKIKSDMKANCKKTDHFKGEMLGFNKESIKSLKAMEKAEVENIKVKVGEKPVKKENQKAVLDSISKLVAIDYVKGKSNYEKVDGYMDEESFSRLASSLKPFVSNMLKSGDSKKINKIINGKNPAKELGDMLDKNIKSLSKKEKSSIEAEAETQKMADELDNVGPNI